MLKKIRVGVSLLLFILITFYFLDFVELIPNDSLNWLPRIQFVPALLAGHLIVLIVLILLTVLFGRVYCSSICPMGIYQDIITWFSKRTAKKKKRHKFSQAKNILRWSVLALTVVGAVSGFTIILGLLDPYSAYGRIVANIFRPAYMGGNNLLEYIFTSFGNYTFYRTDIFINSVFALSVSVLTFLIIGFMAWKHGRTYCNTICPVGTVLGFLSRFSLFKIRIDESKCNGCGSCEMKCKASCINSKEHVIDYSRCVNCFNCLESCNKKALSFTPKVGRTAKTENIVKPVDSGKRLFLKATFTAPLLLVQDKTDSLVGEKSYARKTPIAPPGAISIKHLSNHCTSCHLCISKCPSRVLKPALMEYGLGGIMQPTMYFEKGFCNFDCTICSEVCPNEAIKPLTKDEKHLTQGGYVVFNEDICVVHTDGTNCGACAEHCPTQAVTMIPYENGLTIPHINPEICVGCGGCEFICPVRPYRAIHVEGHTVQKQAKPFEESEKFEEKIDSFGF
ncbi:4Fe-4S binding protein [Dysgonomonas sp. ZJ709]|uniref:4Fe-4S binding protein n=1 Tax=Dysgonomonas sp. ZJ709 TaxID=2709797 RepID=UPI0013EA8F3A|nr:4Fe-4S binding protein [Dysgonomonas sp. ZJ709]